jgi:hypothetical protein
MTNKNTRARGGVSRWLGPLLWVGGSFLLFYILFFDPLNVHPVDSWLQALRGDHLGSMTVEGAGEREILFYRNPMDATVTSPVPAQDEMGMDYVPVYADESGPSAGGEREILFYRNPMDPTITSPVPAQDEMGMDYVPVYDDEARQAMGAGTTVSIDPERRGRTAGPHPRDSNGRVSRVRPRADGDGDHEVLRLGGEGLRQLRR